MPASNYSPEVCRNPRAREGSDDVSHEQAVAYQKMAREAAEGASAEDGLLAGRRRR